MAEQVKSVIVEPNLDLPKDKAPPAPGAAPQTQTDPKAASRFAALARKEQGIVAKQQDVKSREEALAAREKAIADRETAFESEWKSDPTKAAEKRGLTYAEWTQRVLNDGKPSADSQVGEVRDEIAKLRKEREDEREAAKASAIEAEKAASAKVLEDFKSGVKAFIADKADTFEFINLHSAQNLVIATIEEHFANTNEILSTDKACELVEKFLEEQVMKSTETKKFKAKATPQPEVATKQSPNAGSQSKTLTNNMTASTPGFLPAKNEADRIKRALAALERTKP